MGTMLALHARKLVQPYTRSLASTTAQQIVLGSNQPYWQRWK